MYFIHASKVAKSRDQSKMAWIRDLE